VHRNNRCSFWDRLKHTRALCEQIVKFLISNPAVHVVATRLVLGTGHKACFLWFSKLKFHAFFPSATLNKTDREHATNTAKYFGKRSLRYCETESSPYFIWQPPFVTSWARRLHLDWTQSAVRHNTTSATCCFR